MESRRNLLVGIVVVAASVYATGLSGRLLIFFGRSSEYESAKSATAPELAAGNWINSDESIRAVWELA
jgi:hypothetical protein